MVVLLVVLLLLLSYHGLLMSLVTPLLPLKLLSLVVAKSSDGVSSLLTASQSNRLEFNSLTLLKYFLVLHKLQRSKSSKKKV